MNDFQFSQNKLVLPFLSSHFFPPPICFVWEGKNPEDVVKRYTEKIKVLPDEVRTACPDWEGLARVWVRRWPQVEVRLSVLALAGLHHLHGEAARVLRLRGPPTAQGPQARAGGQAWQVWPHVPSAVPGGHVQQRQQGG